jgi:uncharacterized protein (TIGR03083 family)
MSRPAPEPAVVLALFNEGVEAFVRLAGQAAAADAWDRPACGTWSAADLARHELDVIGWYHGWLDRALAGDASPAFDIDVIDERTDAGVRALADVDPGDAVARFAAEAPRYAERLEPNWDLPFGYPRGTVTAGLHAGMAVCEWHLHSWDLARALGTDHRPSDPGTILVAASACRAATGGIRQKVERTLASVAARTHAWETILSSSGRKP